MEEKMAQAAEEFADQASKMSDDPYIREGIMKMAVREIVWALYDAFDDQKNELLEQLEAMRDAVEQQASEYTKKQA